MKKTRAKEYRITDGDLLRIRTAVADLLGRTPGGQRHRNLQRQLTTLQQALRARGYLFG